MSKKKISWVTPDYFLDVDIPIVPNLLDEYDIIWIILFPWRNNRYKEEDLSKYAKNIITLVFFLFILNISVMILVHFSYIARYLS